MFTSCYLKIPSNLTLFINCIIIRMLVRFQSVASNSFFVRDERVKNSEHATRSTCSAYAYYWHDEIELHRPSYIENLIYFWYPANTTGRDDIDSAHNNTKTGGNILKRTRWDIWLSYFVYAQSRLDDHVIHLWSVRSVDRWIKCSRLTQEVSIGILTDLVLI